MSDHDNHRLSVRFGEEILARGHTAIPNLVLNYYVQLGLSGPELLFTIHVWQHWWSDRDPYPSLRTIAGRMGISIRQAKRYVEALESKGFLRVIERFLPDGSQTTNEFDYSPLIRAVVTAARADGALDPGGNAPTILRRARTRAGGGDISDTPSPDSAVIPGHGAPVTPAPTAAATGPSAATSPKEDQNHAHKSDTDGEACPQPEGLADVLDLFAAAMQREATRSEGATLGQPIAHYAAAAKHAMPPARSDEWVAAALLEVTQAQGAPFALEALRPALERYAALTAPSPAALRGKRTAPRPGAPDASLAIGRSEFGTAMTSPPAPPSLAAVWQAALDDLREQMAPTNFSRWLARTQLLHRAGGEAVIGAPDQVIADQLARRFDPLVRRALADACGEPVAVRYEVAS